MLIEIGANSEYSFILDKVSFLIKKPIINPKMIGIIKYKIGNKLKTPSLYNNLTSLS